MILSVSCMSWEMFKFERFFADFDPGMAPDERLFPSLKKKVGSLERSKKSRGRDFCNFLRHCEEMLPKRT